MNNDNKPSFLRVGTPACGAFMALLGTVLALLLVYIGFWRTLLVAVFAALGYFAGASPNKTESIKRLINRVFPPKDE